MVAFTTPNMMPSLKEWLGDGDRAEGFAEWVMESALASHILDAAQNPRDASFMRLVQFVLVAAVEGVKRECEEHGADYIDALATLAHAMGYAAMGAAFCNVEGDIPPKVQRLMRKTLTDAFESTARKFVEEQIRMQLAARVGGR